MKKVFFVFAVVLFISMSSFKTDYFDQSASECVQQARSATFEIAEAWGDHPNDDPFYMELYMELYSSCME